MFVSKHVLGVGKGAEAIENQTICTIRMFLLEVTANHRVLFVWSHSSRLANVGGLEQKFNKYASCFSKASV